MKIFTLPEPLGKAGTVVGQSEYPYFNVKKRD